MLSSITIALSLASVSAILEEKSQILVIKRVRVVKLRRKKEKTLISYYV